MTTDNDEVLIKVTLDEGQTDARIKTVSGSLGQLREHVLAATLKYQGLTKEQQQNDQVSGHLQKRVQDLNKEYDEQNKKLDTSKKTVVEFVRELKPFGVNIGQTFDAFKTSGQSIVGFVKGLGTIKSAIAATGIGLLLLALGALYTYLTRSQAGIDFLSRKAAGLSAVFQKLTGIVVTVGEKIFNAFTSPKAAIKELADFVATNLTNRFRAFGVILDALINRDWRAAVDGVIQLGTGITDATGKAGAFVTTLNSVRKGAEGVAIEYVATQLEQHKEIQRPEIFDLKDAVFNLPGFKQIRLPIPDIETMKVRWVSESDQE